MGKKVYKKTIFFPLNRLSFLDFFFKPDNVGDLKNTKEIFNQNREVGVKKRPFVFLKKQKKKRRKRFCFIRTRKKPLGIFKKILTNIIWKFQAKIRTKQTNNVGD